MNDYNNLEHRLKRADHDLSVKMTCEGIAYLLEQKETLRYQKQRRFERLYLNYMKDKIISCTNILEAYNCAWEMLK